MFGSANLHPGPNYDAVGRHIAHMEWALNHLDVWVGDAGHMKTCWRGNEEGFEDLCAVDVYFIVMELAILSQNRQNSRPVDDEVL